MDQQALSDIVASALNVLRPLLAGSTSKLTYAYFGSTPEYADSWVRAQRKGGGFMGMSAPDPAAPIEFLDFAITFKPGVLGPEWVGYTFQVANPETQPVMNDFDEWAQAGGQAGASYDKLAVVRDHMLKLLQQPVLTNEPPRESPETMY